MIITRTPFRISFAGGGSDLKEYYLEHGGSVVSTTIDKYIYLSMHPYFSNNKIFLKYSKNELVERTQDIEHNIIRTLFTDYKITGVDFNSSADVPAGTGLGSSSTFTVGCITLCNAYCNTCMTRDKVAEYACQVEIERLKEPIGKQDQYAAAYGGLNSIRFFQDDTVSVERIILDKTRRQRLENSLMMFFLGDTREARKILAEQQQNIRLDGKKIDNLHKMVQLSETLRNAFCRGDIDVLGEILHAGWMYKKELSSGISNGRIDHYYELARNNGARGGKLLGAGGCGFLLFSVPEDDRDRLRHALAELMEFPFQFENTGTTVIYYT